jgi:tetratricopeptide (TPR) repeat protein
MKTSLSSLLLAAALPLVAGAWPAPAHAFDATAVAAARRDLQSAVNHGDLGALLAVRARFAALSAAEPDAALLHDWVAVATWRALPLEIQKDRKLAEKLGDDAITHAEKAIAADPKDAEALAILGGLQGMMTTLRPGDIMTLGPQSGANLARAAALAPNDPRVALLQGIGDLHKPAQFGGGPEVSLPDFRRAQELFAKESVADSTAPDWGRDDACLWEGQALARLSEWEKARDAYRRALEANPANGWVHSTLLPEAEKKVATAKDATGGKDAKDAKDAKGK